MQHKCFCLVPAIKKKKTQGKLIIWQMKVKFAKSILLSQPDAFTIQNKVPLPLLLK